MEIMYGKSCSVVQSKTNFQYSCRLWLWKHVILYLKPCIIFKTISMDFYQIFFVCVQKRIMILTLAWNYKTCDFGLIIGITDCFLLNNSLWQKTGEIWKFCIQFLFTWYQFLIDIKPWVFVINIIQGLSS